ncbi:MAG: THUMP domain-containing protein [Desulfobacterota bacterium]|nr:THUMP domain-containing protein [Thermodesulfobacteriota bacterium]
MKESNLLISTYWGQEKKALHFLSQHGEFKRSGFKDVLLGHVEDVNLFLEKMERMRQEEPERINFISQIVPLERTFYFELPQFMDRLKEVLLPYVERIGEQRFYVRVRRRGHKGDFSSQEVEKGIAEFLIENLEKFGKEAHVSFRDPEMIVVIETIANWAGVSLITKAMKEAFPFVRVK